MDLRLAALLGRPRVAQLQARLRTAAQAGAQAVDRLLRGDGASA
jgi:hypothetical protein